MNYLSDTISMIDETFGDQSLTYIIKTDEGRERHKYYEDSLVSIMKDSWLDILQIELDNTSQGIISFYDADTSKTQNEEPRWTGNNYHFTLNRRKKNAYQIVIDWGFTQFGRQLDTLDLISVNPNVLILDSDTLVRVRIDGDY